MARKAIYQVIESVSSWLKKILLWGFSENDQNNGNSDDEGKPDDNISEADIVEEFYDSDDRKDSEEASNDSDVHNIPLLV